MSLSTERDIEFFQRSLSEKLHGCEIRRMFCPWWNYETKECMRTNEIHRKYQTNCPDKKEKDD